MNLVESFQIALDSLAANKLRAVLTMLGIIIGVAAVITMLGIGRGAQASIEAQIQSAGTNLLFIRPGAQRQGGVAQAAGSAATLTYADARALAEEGATPSVAAVAPEFGAARRGRRHDLLPWPPHRHLQLAPAGDTLAVRAGFGDP